MDWELSRQHLLSGYVPYVVVLLVAFLILHVIGKRQRCGYAVLSFIFSFYLIGILTMTEIWYRSAFNPRIVYIPFADMVRGPVATGLNVILFVPLGFFLPILYEIIDSVKKILVIGFFISLTVEIVQMFGCGTTDINDLITNTVGACVGYGIYKLVYGIVPKAWAKELRIVSIPWWFELIFLWASAIITMLYVQPIIYHATFR